MAVEMLEYSEDRLGTIEQPIPQAKLVKTNPLSRKLNSILQGTGFDDQITQTALSSLLPLLASESTNSSLQDIQQRNLLGLVESKRLASHTRLAEAFKPITTQLDAIQAVLTRANNAVDRMESDLSLVQSATTKLTSRTFELKTERYEALTFYIERHQAAVRELIAKVFREKFVFSDVELSALSTVTDAFFLALDHLKRISEDSKALLSSENPMAGIELIEKLAGYEAGAYTLLFSWTSTSLRALAPFSPSTPIGLKSAFSALRNRADLFETCVDNLTNIRRDANSRAFVEALTRGNKPIEMHAHDPLRYVGDMLAWVHQCACNERETIEGVLGETDDAVVGGVLDSALEGVIRPLRVRVDQVLASGPGAIVAYKIAGMVRFYETVIEKSVGGTKLSVALGEMSSLCHRVFFDLLNSQASELLRYVGVPDDNLSVPASVKDVVGQCRDILASYDGSLLSEEEKEKEVERVLTASLDPLLQMLHEAATHLGVVEGATYMINCLHFIHMALVLYPFTGKHVKVLDQQMDGQIGVLVGEMYMHLLSQSRLAPFVFCIENNEEKVPLSGIEEMNHKAISDAMAFFDLFLGRLGPGDSSSFITRSISSNRLARQVLAGGYKRFLESYKLVYDGVMDPANGYDYPNSILPRSLRDVETLFAMND